MRCPACGQSIALASPAEFVPHFPNQRNVVAGPRVMLCPGVPAPGFVPRLIPRDDDGASGVPIGFPSGFGPGMATGFPDLVGN